ncbi:MAG: hypothetical protein ABIS14_07935 [Sphingomonas sp.]
MILTGTEQTVALCLGGVFGATLAAFPKRMGFWFLQRYQRRFAQRVARGSDQFFEEQRQLESYPPITNPRIIRLFGIAMIAFCSLSLLLKFNYL